MLREALRIPTKFRLQKGKSERQIDVIEQALVVAG
jgi:hypothetical protein